MEILSYDRSENYIVLRNKDEGQVVRLFYSSYEAPIDFEPTHKELIRPFVCINRLYVDPTYRKQGWATFIVNELINIFKDCETIIVVAKPDDELYMSKSTLRKFYNKFGFSLLREVENGSLMIRYK